MFPKLRSDRHFSTSPGTEMVNRSARNGLSGHFFETHCLRCNLKVVMKLGALSTMLILDWIRHAAGVELDDIALANETKTIRPHRQCTLDPATRPSISM